jgi:PleD family two-component response regulator
MQTHVVSSGTAATKEPLPTRTGATQRVLIVNGSGDVLDVLEPMLDAGKYDVVFVESSAHAYSQIKRVQPDLVILCLEMEDAEALTVLSMLKLDEETRGIPVVTYTTSGDEEEEDDEEDDPEPPMFAPRPALLMN